jgi:hypothetical protein
MSSSTTANCVGFRSINANAARAARRNSKPRPVLRASYHSKASRRSALAAARRTNAASRAALLNIVERFPPGLARITVAPVFVSSPPQLGRKFRCQGNGGGLQAIPELLGELNSLFRREVREVEDRGTHHGNLCAERMFGKRIGVCLTEGWLRPNDMRISCKQASLTPASTLFRWSPSAASARAEARDLGLSACAG